MDNCDNLLTKHLKNISQKINPVFKYFNLTQYDIISLGLIINGIGLMYLLTNNFYLFLICLLVAHFCNILNILYVKQFNIPTQYGNNYDNLANWFKVVLTLLLFVEVYSKKVNDNHFYLAVSLLIICNIHYSIKTCLKKKIGKKIDYYMECWIKPICKLKKEDLDYYCSFTKYFDENAVFIYLTILMIYIHNKK